MSPAHLKSASGGWNDLRLGSLRLFVAFTAWLVAASLGNAAGLTYVDGNADPNFGANMTPQAAFEYLVPTTQPVNNLWDLRIFASGGTIYEAGMQVEDPPEFAQTLTGLTPAASYDVYVVHWSTTGNWNVKAGFSPGTGAEHNRFGPSDLLPNAIAGTEGGLADWDVSPTDNPAINDPEGIYREQGRNMYLGKVGTTTASGSGEIAVYVDDLFAVTALRTFYDGLAFAPAGTPVFLGATVARGDGNITISNPTDSDFKVQSYSVRSTVGALNSTAWDKIAADGDGDAWTEVAPGAPDASTTVLTETETVGPLSLGATLAAGGELDLGNIWIRSPLEDVTIDLTLVDGLGATYIATITAGYSGAEFKLGDFNFDNDVDVGDFGTMMANMHVTPGAGVTAAELYGVGDITGNGSINFDDFAAFRAAYEAENGVGSFASVPEPQSWVLIIVAAAMSGGLRFVRRHASPAGQVKQFVRFQTIREFDFMSFFAGKTNSIASAFVASFVLGAVVAHAAPVSGWTKDPLNNSGSPAVPLSGELTDSPVLGDGVTNLSGDNCVLFATIPLVALTPGQQITLSGSVSIIGATQRNDVVRWGLFKDDGAGAATAGWLGFLADNGGGGNTGLLWSKDPAGTNFTTVTHQSTTNSRGFVLATSVNPAPTFPANGTFDFEMTIGKFDNNNHAVVTASLIGTDGWNEVWSQVVETNPARVTTAFDRVSLLSSSVGDVEQMAFSGIDVTVAPVVAPKLQVVQYAGTDGVLRIVNDTGAAVDMSYYEIRSTLAGLDAAGFNGLDAQEGGDPVGTGWEPTGGNGATILSEGNLLSMTTVANGGSLNLGAGHNQGGATDLSFSYAAPGGPLLRGLVEFVAGVQGDVNFDGVVDIFDVNVVSDNWGSTGPVGDANFDKVVDIFDVNVISDNWGEMAGGGVAAVPEPATWFLLALGAACVARFAVRRS